MDDVFTAPTLVTIVDGIIVKRPDGQAAPPQVGEYGAASVGAGHMPGVGPVIYVAVHDSAGETLMMTLGVQGFRSFAMAMNATAARVMNGLYDKPEVAQ